MKNTRYAIVDIETTGGYAGGSSITEIAIRIHDGTEVIERWESLINPQREIPLHIVALTGINDDMVRDAPLFEDVAAQVFQLLEGCVFVAHHVNFDYSFIRHELVQAGFAWSAKKLCTVRASRKIRPGLHSYSLGKLCASLDIPLENRHRAGGDADATAILFTRLLQWDSMGELVKMIKKTAADQRLPPNLPPEDFEQLPEKPGVYYFYNRYKKVIYVGKAINLKKRVATHFSGHNINPQRQHFLRDIHAISHEICATELLALILECSEIKKLWPTYNRALKRFDAKYGLYHYEARSGYRYLAIGKLSKFQDSIESFDSEYEGSRLLLDLAQQFELDPRFCKYGGTPAEATAPLCDAPDLPTLQQHNEQVEKALDYLASNRPSFALIDKGRTEDERSCILVENGHFYGMGYLPYDCNPPTAEALKDYLTPYKSNQYIRKLIDVYARKHPAKVLFKKGIMP
ncbi:exonuclease domain-containing protein [Flavobacterium sp. JP2137]|uniref:exonuclease domain-containing protein n=1 Tax=Flavobacterium sp. JP2137 TaxID=3414510 RepID=UPI003D2FFE76